MASRRNRGAAVEPPPPPPPEPTPEPEPEMKEESAPPTPEPELRVSKSSLSKDGKVTEKIIERIIICPGMQNQCFPGMMAGPGIFQPGMYQGGSLGGYVGAPPTGACPCPTTQSSKRKSKKKKKTDGGEPCTHPFCIVQRSKVRPQGLPWASGLYPGPPTSDQFFSPPQQPSLVVCQRPVLCCCPRCRPPEDSEEEDDEEVDPRRTDTGNFMTFMNLVFAAANVINERPEIL